MPYEWPAFLPFLLFFFFASSAAFAALLVTRFAAAAIFFTSAATFFFADWSFFRAASLAFASFIAYAIFSASKIASHVSESTTEHPTIFFDLFFLFATASFMRLNSCALIRS
jgi:hypothetical protein